MELKGKLLILFFIPKRHQLVTCLWYICNICTIQKTVQRRQFPMMAAYAFTDYCSQGQTLLYVIIDIGSPPTGTLSLFNLYVILSRSSERASIRLLHDFDDKLFMASHNPALVDEDERLKNLNIKTNIWYEHIRHTKTNEGLRCSQQESNQ